MSNKEFAKQLVQSVLATAVPIGIVILMQRPAVRQAAAMRLAHTTKIFCQKQADMWQSFALKAGTAYNRARL